MNPTLLCRQRVADLVAAFAQIERTRMVGVPVLNHGLQVEAVGFEPLSGAPEVALGVLVTPWFMNLVCLPLARSDAAVRADQRRQHRLGEAEFEFSAASEPAIGTFESCSLFSPMFEFADQASAVATAACVLQELRAVVAKPVVAQPAERPARRSFLFGRGEVLA